MTTLRRLQEQPHDKVERNPLKQIKETVEGE